MFLPLQDKLSGITLLQGLNMLKQHIIKLALPTRPCQQGLDKFLDWL